MFATVLTAFVGISFIIFIFRVIRVALSGDWSQLFKSTPLEVNSALDPWALENHGLSPGDVGYDNSDD